MHFILFIKPSVWHIGHWPCGTLLTTHLLTWWDGKKKSTHNMQQKNEWAKHCLQKKTQFVFVVTWNVYNIDFSFFLLFLLMWCRQMTHSLKKEVECVNRTKVSVQLRLEDVKKIMIEAMTTMASQNKIIKLKPWKQRPLNVHTRTPWQQGPLIKTK